MFKKLIKSLVVGLSLSVPFASASPHARHHHCKNAVEVEAEAAEVETEATETTYTNAVYFTNWFVHDSLGAPSRNLHVL